MDARGALTREPAFPLYRIAWAERLEAAPAGYAGRVIFAPGLGRWKTTEQYLQTIGDRDTFLAALTPDDVLWVPLYEADARHSVEYPLARLSDYAARLQFIAEAAPLVKAVLLANMGAEFCFWSRRQGGGPRFAREHAALVAERGGRVAFSPTSRELMLDCIKGSPLRAAMHEVGALQMCLSGYKFVPGCYIDFAISCHDRFIEDCHKHRDKVRKYLEGIEVWSGVQFDVGLGHGNDRLLAEFGFDAGVVG